MTETMQSVEAGKPNPISLREIVTMDPKDLKAFSSKLSKDEKKEFGFAMLREQLKLTKDERKEFAQMTIDRIQKIENKTLKDKLDLGLAKLRRKTIDLEKPPIFFRKLRQEPYIPKFLRNAKSPYFLSIK